MLGVRKGWIWHRFQRQKQQIGPGTAWVPNGHHMYCGRTDGGGVPQPHRPCSSYRDNLYQVELEPSTSTELRYQRVRKAPASPGAPRGEVELG